MPIETVSYEEIVQDIRETVYGHPFGKADSLTDMNYSYEAMAVLDRFVNYDTMEEAAAVYAGERTDINGIDALTKVLFEEARSRIDTDPSVERFNEVTDDWPHVLRGKLAGYEYLEGRSGEYEDRLEAFAEAEGWIDMELTQTELSHYHDNNPYNDPSLSDSEAMLVMVARMRDLDERPIAEADISDASDLKWWLKRADSTREAVRAHHFGRDVNETIVAEAAAPGDWQVLDPGTIDTQSCERCGDDLYLIEPADDIGNPTWYTVTNSGSAVSGSATNIGEPAGDYYRPNSTGGEMLCGGCEVELQARLSTNLAISSDNGILFGEYGSGTFRRTGGIGIEDLDSEARTFLDAYMSSGPSDGPDTVRLDTPARQANTPPSAQADLIEGVVYEQIGEPSEAGPLIYEHQDTHHGIVFPSTSAEAAYEAKTMLENATQYV